MLAANTLMARNQETGNTDPEAKPVTCAALQEIDARMQTVLRDAEELRQQLQAVREELAVLRKIPGADPLPGS